MEEGILISFEANNEAVQESIDLLVQMGKVDQSIADQYKKSQAVFDQRAKATDQQAEAQKRFTDSTAKSAKNLDVLSAAFKKLTQNIPNGALNQLSSEILTGINEALVESGISAEEFLKKLSAGTEGTTTKVKTIKGELRAMKEELNQLELQGKENTAEFEQLAIAAAKLEDQIGDTNVRIRALADDSRGIKTVAEGVQGVVAAFSIAQSAQAIFGDESRELQETLVKLNAAMALLNGVTSLNTILQKQSYTSILITNVQRKAEILYTNLETSAQSRNVIVKYAAVAAQNALNVVMKASPAGLLIGTFTALAGAVVFFSGKTKSATEDLAEANRTAELFLNNIKRITTGYKDQADAAIAQAEAELRVAEARGDSKESLREREARIDQLRVQAAQNAQSLINSALNQGGDGVEQLTVKYEGLRGALLDAKGAEDVYVNGKKVARAEVEKQLQQIEDQIELIKQVNLNYTLAVANQQANAQKRQNDNLLSVLQGVKTEVEARLLGVEKGSQQEFNLRRSLLQADRDLQLANVELTKEEVEKIEAQYAKNIRDLNREQLLLTLNDQKAAIEARLAQVQKGTEEELALRNALIRKQRDIDLQAEGITAGQRLKINADSNKQILDNNRQFGFDNAKIANDIDRSRLNTRLALAEEGSSEQLQIQLDLIENQADADKLAAQESITNRELLQAKITEIDTNADRARAELKRQAQLRDIEQERRTLEELILIRERALVRLANDPFSSNEARQKANIDLLKLERDRITNDMLANEQALDNKLITYAEYLAKKEALDKAYGDNLASQILFEEQLRRQQYDAITSFAINSFQQIANFGAQIAQQNIAEEEREQLESLDKRRTKELDNKNLTEAQKKAINDKYAKEEARIKRIAAEKQRAAEITQAEINGLLAITSILAQYPKFDGGVAMALALAAATLTTGLQIAAIKSKPLPEYHTGVELVKKGIGEALYPDVKSYEVLAKLKVGERVVDPETNKQYFPALSAIHNKKVSPEVANRLLSPEALRTFDRQIVIPKTPEGLLLRYDQAKESGIDINLLAKSMAREMANMMVDIMDTHDRDNKRAMDKFQQALERIFKGR